MKRLDGAVVFLLCRDGGGELCLDGRAFATRRATAQLAILTASSNRR
jgi:hypothetical protein